MEAPIGQIPLTEVQWKKELGDKYFNEISNYKIYIYFIYWDFLSQFNVYFTVLRNQLKRMLLFYVRHEFETRKEVDLKEF